MIDSKTKIYGVFGYPIKHSLSPAMHNAAFQKLGLNAVYVAFEVDPKRIGEALKTLPVLGISGVNLTIPHKELCLPYLDELSEEAVLLKAVNTIVVKGKKLIGYNTDGIGFLRAVREDLHLTVKRKKVFIIGAGGAGRAIAIQLARAGASRVWLSDCAKTKVIQLAVEIKTHFPGCDVMSAGKDVRLESFDLFVNATPVGMKKKDPLLIKSAALSAGLAVYDLVYNAGETKLVRAAKRRGLRAVNGLNMLLYQGAASFKIWTGKYAPVETMRKAMLKELSS